MSRFRYVLHGLTIGSAFRVHSWDSARLIDQSAPVELAEVSLLLRSIGGQQNIPDGEKPTRPRRGGLYVARVPGGLCMRTASGDVAWLSDGRERDHYAHALGVRLRRTVGANRALFERALCNILLPNILAVQGHRMVHAAAVIIAGKAVLFCGDSGAGKSTLAAGFSTLGFEVLSDDVLRLTCGADGGWSAYPSYPGLHLRPETFLDVPACAGTRRGKQWIPLTVNPKLRQGVPVAAMYALGRQSRVAPSILLVGGVSALEQWMRALFMDGVSRERRAPEAFEAAASLARNVPTFGLRYRRSPQHFSGLLKSIVEHAEGLGANHHAGLL